MSVLKIIVPYYRDENHDFWFFMIQIKAHAENMRHFSLFFCAYNFFLSKSKSRNYLRRPKTFRGKTKDKHSFFILSLDCLLFGLVRNYEDKHRTGGIFYTAIKYNLMNRPIFTNALHMLKSSLTSLNLTYLKVEN